MRNPLSNIVRYVRDIGRPVLSDRSIRAYNKRGLLIDGPITEHQLQPNSVDLTLGSTAKTLRSNCTISIYGPIIDCAKEMVYDETLFETLNDGRERFVVAPGEFILMASREKLNIPNGILSIVQGRSSIARLGIQTEQAGLIDAGFRGTITLEIHNQCTYPIALYSGMRMCQCYFFKAQYSDSVYGQEKGSKYSGQIAATGSMIYKDPEFQKRK